MTENDREDSEAGVASLDLEAWKIPKLCIYVSLFMIFWGLGFEGQGFEA